MVIVCGGDVAGLLERFARLREKARARTGKVFPFVVIQEAGLDVRVGTTHRSRWAWRRLAPVEA
jgi:hypothetical protein